jgi:hypothetical protein
LVCAKYDEYEYINAAYMDRFDSSSTHKSNGLPDIFRTLLHELMAAKMRVDVVSLPATGDN